MLLVCRSPVLASNVTGLQVTNVTGLQVTSTGAVKVIERLDASGAGDVDTSLTMRAEPGDVIIGTTGRRLKVCTMGAGPDTR